MTTETLHFQYDPMVLARQLLLIHFESKLKAFDTSLLSHGNYEIKYETPVFIREAVYDALENMSDYQIEYFMGSVAEDYDIKVNNRIWPTEKEKSTGVAVQCRGSNPDWCYTYRDI